MRTKYATKTLKERSQKVTEKKTTKKKKENEKVEQKKIRKNGSKVHINGNKEDNNL